MKKMLISVIIIAIVLVVTVWIILAGCDSKRGKDPDQPGYIPPDLTYETDEKPPEGETNAPETDVPENSDETQPWGEDQPQTDLPETNAPGTNAPETEPAEITPPDTTPPETTPVPETNIPETESPGTYDDDWFESMWGTETPVDETDPPETKLPYFPDNAPAPALIKYVLTKNDSFRNFVLAPSDSVFENGYNVYAYEEDGSLHMRQVTSMGLERYVGEYSGGNMDLAREVIDFVLSGDLQDLLIEHEVKDTIYELCAIGKSDGFTQQTVIWVVTKDGDYFVTYDADPDEGESSFKLYAHKEYISIYD